jgi:N-acetyl sugar amidotransferase
MIEEYRVCSRCVMDTTVTDIRFDEEGICNYCSEFYRSIERMHKLGEEQRKESLEILLKKIRDNGKNKEYDCILGVSGGLDSSYTLYSAKKLGLKPLAVHLDNGWDSELAVSNIEKLVKSLDVDLYTHVINWEEFKDLQIAFFKANVVDIEMLTDHAIQTLLYRIAKDRGLKYIVTGTNVASEGMRLPPGWIHLKMDARNIRSIYKRFENGIKIETFPLMGLAEYAIHLLVRGITWISFPDFIDYRKDEAIQTLNSETGWRPYEKKHYESVFTRFYQGYILPKKFYIDKRRMHYSSLICSGQTTREAVLELLEKEPYDDPLLLIEDKEFVLKKLGFDDKEFEQYINSPTLPHTAYSNDAWILSHLMLAARIIRKSFLHL